MTSIERELRNNFNRIWRCADSYKWHILRNLNRLTFDWLNPETDYRSMDLSTLERGQNSIKPWVNHLRAGDLIFLMGKNYYSGVAIALTNYDFNGPFVNMGADGDKPAIEVQYIHKLDTPVNHGINAHNNPAAFSDIENYSFGLNNVITFLENHYPEVLQEIIEVKHNMNTLLEVEKNFSEHPLNIIMYGPPGTGKTHKLKSYYFPLFTSKKRQLNQSDFNSRVRQYTWWQVIAAALYNFPEGIKVPNLADSNLIRAKHSPSVKYPDPNHIIWNILQRNPELFEKDSNAVWKVNRQIIDENFPVIKELHGLLADDALSKLEIKEDEKENYKFITFHQSFAYEDFIQGIKPDLSNENDEKAELNYKMNNGLFYLVCLKALELAGYDSFETCYKDSKEERLKRFEKLKEDPEKRVAIFIDEINRGNISAIFGELITLIEEDKRIGGKNEIWVDLPYSKEKFSIPSNLYIIGTMNTADRSVEALDTALRRRFSFVEMLPQPELLEDRIVGEGINLTQLLETINNRIEALVDRDHTIGHAYLMKVDSIKSLQETFAKNIIPLLQEYFFGNYAKMEMVIGTSFFQDINDKVEFAVNENEYYDDSVKRYKLRDIRRMNENEFALAIKKLINPKYKEILETLTDTISQEN